MKVNIKNDQLTCIDLFAGCGGLGLGLEKAGFFPLYVNELNKDALESYLINRDDKYPHLRERFSSNDIKDCIKNENFFADLFRDLKKYFSRDFKKTSVDLICGGPPCQGFSAMGIRRSYSVDKKDLPSNHLYEDMVYFISKMRPKIFLFENVEGLLRAKWDSSGRKGEVFNAVLSAFKGIPGYKVSYKLIKAKDYGVPQNRPRVLLVGIKESLAPSSVKKEDDAILSGFLPEGKRDYPSLEEVLSDLIDEDFEYGNSTKVYKKNPLSKWQKEIRTERSGKLIAKGELLTDQEYSNHSKRVVERFSAMIKNDGIIPPNLRTKKFAQKLLKKKWPESGPNITACSLADDYVHYEQARALTVREWARLQTFPDWYRFAGKRTTGGIRRAGNPRENIHDREVPKYTQIGNAVPVKLGYEVGLHFKKIIKNKI